MNKQDMLSGPAANTQQKAEMTHLHIALLYTNMLLKMAKSMWIPPYEMVSLFKLR